jgi:hypothetical protein
MFFAGQITAAFGSLDRSIADFEKQARREILTAKRELALSYVFSLRYVAICKVSINRTDH